MKVIVALGGNALLRRGQALSAANQLVNIRIAAAQLARMVAKHSLLLTHGNGPQVGLLALQGAAYKAVDVYPLDVLGAESQGMIGYLLEQELANRLPPGQGIATLVTRVAVDPQDVAFGHPVKPIGPVYTEQEAQQLASAHGWTVAADGAGFRRMVASPLPRKILNLTAIRVLLEQGQVVIAAGGGGVPVIQRQPGGDWQGSESVIDKDRCAALLAQGTDMDCLVLATDVDAVYMNWGTPEQRALVRVTADSLTAQSFAAGTMGPKVAAAMQFVQATGKRAAIGALESLEGLLDGTVGTQIVAS